MVHFNNIIFDLDGTLTDNTTGICNAVKYALGKMNIDGYSEDVVKRFIGPPIQWSFKNWYGLSDADVSKAVDFFREYFGETGWKENIPYHGITELLGKLDADGAKLFLATAKLEKFAGMILKHFGFDRFFSGFVGADYNGHKAEKDQLIGLLLEKYLIEPSKNVVMVGDTVYDIQGAKVHGLSTIAVTYGFGELDELKSANPDFWAKSVEELNEILNE